MAIKWDEIRERGEAGLLTGAETDALCDLAQIMAMMAVGGAGTRCRFCGNPVCFDKEMSSREVIHGDDCPIAVLEGTSNG